MYIYIYIYIRYIHVLKMYIPGILGIKKIGVGENNLPYNRFFKLLTTALSVFQNRRISQGFGIG